MFKNINTLLYLIGLQAIDTVSINLRIHMYLPGPTIKPIACDPLIPANVPVLSFSVVAADTYIHYDSSAKDMESKLISGTITPLTCIIKHLAQKLIIFTTLPSHEIH